MFSSQKSSRDNFEHPLDLVRLLALHLYTLAGFFLSNVFLSVSRHSRKCRSSSWLDGSNDRSIGRPTPFEGEKTRRSNRQLDLFAFAEQIHSLSGIGVLRSIGNLDEWSVYGRLVAVAELVVEEATVEEYNSADTALKRPIFNTSRYDSDQTVALRSRLSCVRSITFFLLNKLIFEGTKMIIQEIFRKRLTSYIKLNSLYLYLFHLPCPAWLLSVCLVRPIL